MREEVWISVDCETDGPHPSPYSLLSLGAALVDDPSSTFYRELKPDGTTWIESALKASGLDRDRLLTEGAPPERAMSEFAAWLDDVSGPTGRPVFVGWNATFDWMFTHTYLLRYAGRDPFGISGLDLKALYMGIERRSRWSDTAKRSVDKKYLSDRPHTHNALEDALEQADICRKLRTKLTEPRPA